VTPRLPTCLVGAQASRPDHAELVVRAVSTCLDAFEQHVRLSAVSIAARERRVPRNAERHVVEHAATLQLACFQGVEPSPYVGIQKGLVLVEPFYS
jgi:hypothetical protein